MGQGAKPDTIPGVPVVRIPRFNIGWSKESGWWAEVLIHDETMFQGGPRKVFENCASPEHAFALANHWVKENLPAGDQIAKSMTASSS